METQRLEYGVKTKINLVLKYLLFFTEFTLIVSILIFCFFIIKGYLNLGHLPLYGDKEIISIEGFDRTMVIVMLYPMFYGIFLWIIFTISGFITGLRRKCRFTIIGLVLSVLNILIMNSSQFSWIID